ncbi:hypothetical protein CTAYLR_003686 [Chrysophaeum taylorii]|uniref:Glycoside hydrolase family 5 domain-containing protein n=1 Tax=Chrysophaeum taylorii TaxID=2483200 RepID=A0AAD7UNV1_9STRA|nr:hypothetical protein CTAYLR_003686 [Chrysophaeum taylorii]
MLLLLCVVVSGRLRIEGGEIWEGSERIQLACGSWYGAEQQDYVPGGLDTQPLFGIVGVIRESLRLNCVRLPVSLELVLHDPGVRPEAVAANPQLLGLSGMRVLDAVVAALKPLYVILDNHVGRANWCCDARDGEGLWFSRDFSEADWLAGLEILATRYRVAAIELRNEIRPLIIGDALLEPTWGGAEPDWASAAERAADVVLAANPDLLVVVGGLDFGIDLRGVRSRPLAIPSDHLLYSTHNYVWSCPRCDTYDDFAKEMNASWGFVRFERLGAVMLGEFGTPQDTDFSSSDDVQARWWRWLRAYVQEYHPGISFAYWPIDGTQSPGRTRVRGARETYGLLNTRWNAPASEPHLAQVRAWILNEEGSRVAEL